MITWLKRLFSKGPTNLEVTLNVPTIHVVIHGQRESETGSASEGGPGAQDQERGHLLRSAPPITDEQRLGEFEGKLGEIPNVEFGQETTESDT
jgi:hypothetical protein